MRRRTLATLATLAALSTSFALADDGPTSKVETQERPKVTLVDLEAKDRPLADVVAEVGKAMGYATLADPSGALANQKWTCKWAKKPAWECLVEVFEKTGTTIGNLPQGGGVGLMKVSGQPVRYRVAGGLLFRFQQVAPGATAPDTARARPFQLSILAEPRVAWTLAEAKVSGQKDAAGKEKDMLALEVVGGRPQVRAGKDAASPWGGISAFDLAGTAEIVTKARTAEVTGLASGAKKAVVEDAGHEVATVESIGPDGNFVVVVVSAPSSFSGEAVYQGGRGLPVEDTVEKQSGARVELRDAKDALVTPTVTVLGGDGKRLKLELKLTTFELQQVGGIEKLKLRVTVPVEKAKEPFSVKFTDLLAKK